VLAEKLANLLGKALVVGLPRPIAVLLWTENALREAGIEPTVIASDDVIAGAPPLVHAKCTVIKVHGDYLDARIKNTDAELVDYSPAMNARWTRSSIISGCSRSGGPVSGTQR
jgi:hypothetical protein